MTQKKGTAEERRAAGLCEKCGSKPLASMHFCKDCLAERREKAKARKNRTA